MRVLSIFVVGLTMVLSGLLQPGPISAEISPSSDSLVTGTVTITMPEASLESDWDNPDGG